MITASTFAPSYDAAVASLLPAYMGLVFAEMCQQYLPRYVEDTPYPIGEIGEWWGANPRTRKQARVDVVALAAKPSDEQAGRRFVVGSCKHKSELFDLRDELPYRYLIDKLLYLPSEQLF